MSKSKERKLETIKEISGRILLYFYYLKREDSEYFKLRSLTLHIEFTDYTDPNKPTSLKINNSDISEKIRTLVPKDLDIYNSLIYLKDKNFLNFTKKVIKSREALTSFEVTSDGLDIIEGVERGEGERKEFKVNFNLNVNNNFNVESLLKAEIGSLIKGSLLG